MARQRTSAAQQPQPLAPMVARNVLLQARAAADLKLVASAEGFPVSAIIRRILLAYIANPQPVPPTRMNQAHTNVRYTTPEEILVDTRAVARVFGNSIPDVIRAGVADYILAARSGRGTEGQYQE